MRFPKAPVRFRRLVVPEPGFRIQGIFHPRHAGFLGRIPSDGAGGSAKVWLSRTGLGPEGRCPGERPLERRLAAVGWQIIHPERLGVVEQVHFLRDAAVVAGLEGSAFHAAVLLDGATAPFSMLRRTKSRNYRAIADRKGIAEFDLYGAFRIHARSDRRLARPHRTAEMVDELAQQIVSCREDPVALAQLRQRAEAEHDFPSWERRQRRHRISHVQAFIAERKLSKRLRWALRRAFGV